MCSHRGDERGGLLRAGRAAPCLRWIRAVLHHGGHGVRPARLRREVHTVQVHQVPRAEGNG